MDLLNRKRKKNINRSFRVVFNPSSAVVKLVVTFDNGFDNIQYVKFVRYIKKGRYTGRSLQQNQKKLTVSICGVVFPETRNQGRRQATSKHTNSLFSF